MGRAGVNTALTDPFYTDKTAHGMKQDAYNQAPQSMWPTFAAQFAASLGVFDGLDYGVCGNQPLASASAADGGSAGEYGTLAGILANDQLLLDTAVSGCSGAGNYLAVEVGVISNQVPASCGGRTPLDSAIDTTYAVLSGDLTGGVTDEVTGERVHDLARLSGGRSRSSGRRTDEGDATLSARGGGSRIARGGWLSAIAVAGTGPTGGGGAVWRPRARRDRFQRRKRRCRRRTRHRGVPIFLGMYDAAKQAAAANPARTPAALVSLLS